MLTQMTAQIFGLLKIPETILLLNFMFIKWMLILKELMTLKLEKDPLLSIVGVVGQQMEVSLMNTIKQMLLRWDQM